MIAEIDKERAKSGHHANVRNGSKADIRRMPISLSYSRLVVVDDPASHP